MGLQVLPPQARNAAQALAWYGPGWQRSMRRRHSRLGWRRREAYSACQASIRALEAVLGVAPDPWAPQHGGSAYYVARTPPPEPAPDAGVARHGGW